MKLLDSVRVKTIRPEVVPIIGAISRYTSEVTVTGWQDLSYRPDGAHADGRALDLRVWDQASPSRLAQHLKDELYPLSPHYIVLWGDKGHKDHIHVGYHKETRRT